MLLSIIIPCKNEAARLPQTLKTIVDYCTQQSFEYEIIVVDDGSRDRTSEVIQPFLDAHPNITFIRHERNLGKGAAIQTGVLQSAGDVILFTDADLSTPITELSKFLSSLKDFDIMIGSRALDRTLVLRPQPRYRQWIGRIGNFFIRAMLHLPYRDTQCGFKLFRRDAALALFRDLKMQRWSFDYEILYRAHHMHIRVQEVPVHWTHSQGSTFRPLFDAPRCFVDVIRLWLFM